MTTQPSFQVEYHIEFHTVGHERIQIEIIRKGLLWRGSATVVVGSVTTRQPLVVFWADSYNQVRQDMLIWLQKASNNLL